MGKSPVNATLCPNCSYDMLLCLCLKQEIRILCLLCRKAYKKESMVKLFLYLEKEHQVEFEADFEV